MKNITTEKINGIEFQIGYQSDAEFSGPVFTMLKDGKRYGVLMTTKENREIGFNQGVEADDVEIAAIEAAREILFARHWNKNGCFWHN